MFARIHAYASKQIASASARFSLYRARRDHPAFDIGMLGAIVVLDERI